jgi:hypothetical protein
MNCELIVFPNKERRRYDVYHVVVAPFPKLRLNNWRCPRTETGKREIGIKMYDISVENRCVAFN